MQARDETTPPDQIGRYRVVGVIGQGGMGAVYKAVDPDTGGLVAIKTLSPELATDRTFVRRLRREAELLKKLNHPHIVRFIEAGEDGSPPYIVLEYVEGTPISELIRRLGRVPWQQAVEWAIQICDALEHAHQLGVVHRDIKPANVLITTDGMVKLTDFGIAQPYEGTRLTTTGSILGTVEYMSPEQAEGKRVDGRSDLYSLGVLLYHMITGRPPFVGSSYVEVLKRVRFDQPERIHRLVPDIPVWLDDLIYDLLQKQREKRPASAAEVRRRLEAVRRKARLRDTEQLAYSMGPVNEDSAVLDAPTQPLSTEPPRPGPTTLARRFRLEQTDVGRPLERTRRLFARVLGVLAAIALGGIGLAYWSYTNDPERRWAALARELEDPESDPLLLLNRLHDYVEDFPDSPHRQKAEEAAAELELTLARRALLRSGLVRSLRPTGTPPRPAEQMYVRALLLIWLDSPRRGLDELEKLIELLRSSPAENPQLLEMAERDYLALALEVAATLRDSGQEEEARRLVHRALGRFQGTPRPSIRPLLERLQAMAGPVREAASGSPAGEEGH